MSDEENKTTEEHDIIEAHVEDVTIKLEYYYPSHEPRKDDPHFSMFQKTRERLKRLGLLVCWRCGATDNIELHHDKVEWALQNGVDLDKFKHLYPEFHVESDDEFADWVNSEANLLPLCLFCHRSTEGIHTCVYPSWVIKRVWKDSLPEPVRKISGK